jgi:hypothetical protein
MDADDAAARGRPAGAGRLTDASEPGHEPLKKDHVVGSRPVSPAPVSVASRRRAVRAQSALLYGLRDRSICFQPRLAGSQSALLRLSE